MPDQPAAGLDDDARLDAFLRTQGVGRAHRPAQLALLSDEDRRKILAHVDPQSGAVQDPAARQAYRDALDRHRVRSRGKGPARGDASPRAAGAPPEKPAAKPAPKPKPAAK